MSYVMVKHKVADFEAWKKVYDSLEAERVKGGSKSASVFRDHGNPSGVVVLTEWDSLESAQKFNGSEKLKDAMMKAGVEGPPEFLFLDKAGS